MPNVSDDGVLCGGISTTCGARLEGRVEAVVAAGKSLDRGDNPNDVGTDQVA